MSWLTRCVKHTSKQPVTKCWLLCWLCVAELRHIRNKAARCARRGPAPSLGLCLGKPGRRAPIYTHTAIESTRFIDSRPRPCTGRLLGSRCSACDHRVYTALRASLRDGFASLDPATNRKDSAPARKPDFQFHDFVQFVAELSQLSRMERNFNDPSLFRFFLGGFRRAASGAKRRRARILALVLNDVFAQFTQFLFDQLELLPGALQPRSYDLRFQQSQVFL